MFLHLVTEQLWKQLESNVVMNFSRKALTVYFQFVSLVNHQFSYKTKTISNGCLKGFLKAVD